MPPSSKTPEGKELIYKMKLCNALGLEPGVGVQPSLLVPHWSTDAYFDEITATLRKDKEKLEQKKQKAITMAEKRRNVAEAIAANADAADEASEADEPLGFSGLL